MFRLSAARSQSGVTLLEVVIGAAIAGIVLMGVASAYDWIFASLRRAEIKSTVQDLHTEASYRILTSKTLMHSISKTAELPPGINGQLAGCLLKEEGESPVLCPVEPFRVVLVPGKPAGLKYSEHVFSGMGPGHAGEVRVFYSKNGARCKGLKAPTDHCPIEIWSEAQCRYPNCGKVDQAERMNITIHIDVYEFQKNKTAFTAQTVKPEMIIDSTKGKPETGWAAIDPKEAIDNENQWKVTEVAVVAKLDTPSSGGGSAGNVSNGGGAGSQKPEETIVVSARINETKTKIIEGTRYTTPTPLPGVETTDTLICDPLSTPFGGGAGTAADPYRICHPGHWMELYKLSGKHFVLTKNLDMTAVSAAIQGLPEKEWSGVLNGNNNLLFSLELTAAKNRKFLGLFPKLGPNARVESLQLRNFKIPVAKNLCAGWLAGQSLPSTQITDVDYTPKTQKAKNAEKAEKTDDVLVGCRIP